jgi:hypothetical protein
MYFLESFFNLFNEFTVLRKILLQQISTKGRDNTAHVQLHHRRPIASWTMSMDRGRIILSYCSSNQTVELESPGAESDCLGPDQDLLSLVVDVVSVILTRSKEKNDVKHLFIFESDSFGRDRK